MYDRRQLYKHPGTSHLRFSIPRLGVQNPSEKGFFAGKVVCIEQLQQGPEVRINNNLQDHGKDKEGDSGVVRHASCSWIHNV